MAAAIQRPQPGWGRWNARIRSSATAAALADKNIEYVTSRLIDATAAPAEDEIATVLGLTSRIFERLKSRLKAVISKNHPEEDDFDMDLFAALKQAFPSRSTVNVDTNGFIPYVPDDDQGYAFGFARQVRKEQLGVRKNWGGTRNNRHDHAVVIFSRDAMAGIPEIVTKSGRISTRRRTNRWSEWKLRYCLSCIELKMNDTAPVVDESMAPNLYEAGAPIGQALLYSVVDVWTCLNMFNSTPLPFVNNAYVAIPVTVIAAKRESKKDSHLDSCSLLSAELLLPKLCGSVFSYTTRSRSTFADDDHADAAMTRYLQHLCWGVQRWPSRPGGNRFQHGVQLQGKQLSGVEFPLPEAGEPIAVALPVTNRSGVSSQGDLWRVNTTFRHVREAFPHYGIAYWRSDIDQDQGNVEQELVIKVSARAVHPQIVHPLCLLYALQMLSGRGLLNLLEDVFVGMIFCGNGESVSVSVTKDMTSSGYASLHPKSNPAAIGPLWTAFRQLVTNKLVQMAAAGVVFVDLRAGCDWVQNVLVRENNGAYDMVLIDLESLTRSTKIPTMEGEGGRRYIQDVFDKGSTNAVTCANKFVWWQVFLMGFSWARDITADAIDFYRIQEGVVANAGGSNYPDPCADATLESIQSLLDYFDDHFQNGTHAAELASLPVS